MFNMLKRERKKENQSLYIMYNGMGQKKALILVFWRPALHTKVRSQTESITEQNLAENKKETTCN